MEESVEYLNYQQELTYLTSDRERMKYVSGLIENIRKSGNTLVLVDRIKAGNLILENIPDAEFVSGVMKTTDRKDAYTEINEGTNPPVVWQHTELRLPRINIPRIFNLVLLEPGKSFVRVIQSIGRGVRKAQDKDL